MKNKIERKNRIYTVCKLFGWLLILLGPSILSVWEVRNRFERYIGEGKIDADSLTAYTRSIWLMFFIAAGLVLIWWFISSYFFPLKEYFERKTGICAVILVLVCLCMAILLQYKFPGIYRKNESLFSMRYVLCYPWLFASGIMLCSPNNICEIVIPWKKRVRYILGIICVIVSIVIYITGGNQI